MRPREVCGLSLTFLKNFTSKIRNDLAKVFGNQYTQGRCIEAIFKRFPCLKKNMSVPRCRFLQARKAVVDAIKSFTPMQSGAFRESSRLVGLVEKNLKLCKCTKWVMGEPVVVVRLLQHGTENGMFGHPAGKTFALVSSICWLLTRHRVTW